MRAPGLAALFYAASVFAAGAVLGTGRVLVLVPRLGELTAVLLELPLMLAISFLLARRAVALCQVPARLGPRLGMGALAFALLMTAEAALGIWGFGRAPAAHFAGYLHPSAWPGLAGQLVFSAWPALLLLRVR